jgi:CDGSH-type Zn-finger protein/truncated hemoglobin YjbI
MVTPSTSPLNDVRSILARALELERTLADGRTACDQPAPSRDRRTWAVQRIKNSVTRPLQDAVTHLDREPVETAPVDLPRADETGDSTAAPSITEQFCQLASDATILSAQTGLPTEVTEATAALQDLACQFAMGPDGEVDTIARFKALQLGQPSGIRAQVNGPYLVTNAQTLTNWLGERLPVRPQTALCRCGRSTIKPFCDGTHAAIHFTDGKDPKRVLDRRDTYIGQQVTVLDNRGTCAHSGFCTDRLASVFHAGKEPFVTPSGGRMDEIIRAVRACPSGALSYAIDGREAREQVDVVRPSGIEVSKDGPYRVTGGIPLTDGQDRPEARNQGASLEHYSLCRCGHSQNKPFCSGMHWYVQFHDPVPDSDRTPTLFEWAGGLPTLTAMTRIFYSKYVPEDPLVGPLFANMAPDHPERVAAWLGEVFGGPKNYSHQYGGYERMLSQHLGRGLTEAQRARWVSLICQSASDAGLPADAEFRAAFVAYLEWGSHLALENSQPGARPPAHMSVPRWWWACDATPGSRVSTLAPPAEEESPVHLPKADEPVSFAEHIKPLFRLMDRRAMSFAFDLWSHDDVARHAQAILDRLQAGTMPCDGAWVPDRVDVFRRWLESGTRP